MAFLSQIDPYVQAGLTCSARIHRGQQQKHSSMLIHVTRYNAVQTHVSRQVEAYVNESTFFQASSHCNMVGCSGNTR
jgi:Z1 domain